MTKRSEIVAFQMVQNHGYKEALDSIQTKILFTQEDIDSIKNSKSGSSLGMDNYVLSLKELSDLKILDEHLEYLMNVKREILKLKCK